MTEAKRASGFWIGSGGSESRGEKVSCTYSEGREGGEETIYGGKALESKQSISSTPLSEEREVRTEEEEERMECR